MSTQPAFHATPAQAFPMPVTALGFHNGEFHFRSAAGDERVLTAAELLDAPTLIKLFGRERWLRVNFPARFIVVAQRSGGGRQVPVGIDTKAAAWYLSRKCADAEMNKATVARGTQRVSRWTRFWTGLLDWLAGPRQAKPRRPFGGDGRATRAIPR